LSDFFSDSDEERAVYRPSERVAVEGSGVHRFELLVPGSTNNLMDPIMLHLKPGESLEERDPHPGEQFGYVLQGTATLRIGKKSFKVPGKHCFYFESNKPHQIGNEGGRDVSLLWITTPPQM
ncbi:MAG: cupin domain-containing protein, partial [candidate division Zixibacteria bacterium]|nr:cupin domain-containing protein [candidate division Zixibacteria bacterium]